MPPGAQQINPKQLTRPLPEFVQKLKHPPFEEELRFRATYLKRQIKLKLKKQITTVGR